MHLLAAVAPPREVLEGVVDAVESVEPDRVPAEDAETSGRLAGGFLSRTLGRRPPKAEPLPPSPSEPMLDLEPFHRMYVTVAKFGNLAFTDANRLADALEQHAGSWPSPRLSLAGGVALEPEGDDGVWIPLAGDLDALRETAQGVMRVAQGLHLFVDRRVFRPELRIGTVNDLTTEGYLERLLAVLEDFESPSWLQTTLSLRSLVVAAPDEPPFKVYREIALGPPATP